MFISTILGPKRAVKMHELIAKIPKQVRDELEDVVIVYRGVMSADAKEGDLLVRKKEHKVFNIVWKSDYGELREMDSSMLDKLTKFYDVFIQDIIVHENKKTLDQLNIINQKVDLKPASGFKKVNPE
jgi:hypothetical protein